MNTPQHIALIPDGNRRWARRSGQPALAGHSAGIRTVGTVVQAAWQAGVHTVTFWWGSPANLQHRPQQEVDAIIDALRQWLLQDAAALLQTHQASFSIHGRWEQLCPALRPAVDHAHSAAGTGTHHLAVLMAYDGQEEILDAVRCSQGDPTRFEAALWTHPLAPVDLVIRTGGEPHLSAGFMLWWIANAQLHFSPVLWPDFSAQDLHDALRTYANTPRRMGR